MVQPHAQRLNELPLAGAKVTAWTVFNVSFPLTLANTIISINKSLQVHGLYFQG